MLKAQQALPGLALWGHSDPLLKADPPYFAQTRWLVRTLEVAQSLLPIQALVTMPAE